VAGTWRTSPDTRGLVANVQALRRLTRVQRRAAAQAVTRYGRFLEVPVALSVTEV
jgi:hypothetical protein